MTTNCVALGCIEASIAYKIRRHETICESSYTRFCSFTIFADLFLEFSVAKVKVGIFFCPQTTIVMKNNTATTLKP